MLIRAYRFRAATRAYASAFEGSTKGVIAAAYGPVIPRYSRPFILDPKLTREENSRGSH